MTALKLNSISTSGVTLTIQISNSIPQSVIARRNVTGHPQNNNLQMFNYHVAAGMKTVGISAAGGVAEATVEEIVDGYSKYDMYELGLNRFLGLHNNKRFLRDRVKEVPG